ncbi:MAG: GNAT family N-acetyltransferase [Planctomycetes bacterium]|nr:GNAT family N-acetyltransferase [Planctomycetota bacterium]
MPVEPLGKKHDRRNFQCGVPALDRYFRELAGQHDRRGVAAVYVLPGDDGKRVIGYYTLSNLSVRLEVLPNALMKGLPGHQELPAFLIGRLAVDEDFMGQGHGAYLLADALHRCTEYRHLSGALFIVVDAKDETSAEFYACHGFVRLTDDPNRLAIAMKTVEQAFKR